MEKFHNIFIVGIKGVAMCQIAVILKKMGKEVTGTDVAEDFITDEVLNKNGITSLVGFEPTLLPSDADLVLYSAAHGGTDNPIMQAAKTRGIAVLSQAEFLGELLKQFKITIAVCGSHGKTTTSSLLSYALINLGANPSYLIGSSNFSGEGQTFPGGDFKGSDYFVIEADEYGVDPPKDKTPKLEFLHPSHILCTNIDFDHPDIYPSISDVKNAFRNFFTARTGHSTPGVEEAGLLPQIIYCADDMNSVDVTETLQERAEGYGLSEKSVYKIAQLEHRDNKVSFSLEFDGETIENIELSLYGDKNVLNAAGVIAILIRLGFAPEEIKRAIAGFTGPKRRMEKIFVKDDTYLFDDYGHHPAEIKATVSALQKRFPQKKIAVIFQPHTFSRTQALVQDFADALSTASYAYVLPIFASAREKSESFQVTSADIADKSKTIKSVRNKDELLQELKTDLKKGDVVVTMGAGDVYKLSGDIIKVIEAL